MSYNVTELEADVKIFLGLPPYQGWSNMSAHDGYFDRQCAGKYGEAVWAEACRQASAAPDLVAASHPNKPLEPQASLASVLASALVDYINMTGGPDGMSTGSGKDPRLVRASAVEALKLAGINLGQSRPAIKPSGAAVSTYMAPNAGRELHPFEALAGGRMQAVAIVPADQAPDTSR